MSGRRSRGEGSVIYDKRRKKPYRARITVGWELNEETGRAKQIFKDIGSYKTKGEANRALAQYLDNPFDLENKNITFRQLYAKWYDYFMTDDHKSYEFRIKAAFKYCSSIYNKRFRDITILDMKDCIYNGTVVATRGKNKGEEHFASPSTKESMKFLFNHIYEYAIEARLTDKNLAKEFSLDKKVSKEKAQNHKDKIPFSDEEMSKLWSSIEFVPFSDIVVYACYSGWRAGELVELRIENVDLENGFIKGGIKTDAGKNRIVPIHPLVRDIVKKYYDEAITIGSEYLFNDPTKKFTTKKMMGLSYDQYLTRFNNVIDLLHFRKEITPHYTRHTFITKAKNVKMDEYILKIIVGHKIGDMTEHVYTHRELGELKEAIQLIEK